MDKPAFPRGLSMGAGIVIAAMGAFAPGPALAEIKGKCSKAVGTFLTKNTLDNDGRTGTSHSILILTNGGHVIRLDSDETGAAMDSRPFGDSAGTWRCDGVNRDRTVRLTATMLDFTYPDAEGDIGQIARIDMTGTYTPKTEALELKGTLGFLPMNAPAQKADALLNVWNPIAITLRGARIEPPAPSSKRP